jgi:hypothetical protein
MDRPPAIAAPKILLWDIETAPILAYCWGTWDQTIPTKMIERDWYMLTWAAKWLGSREIITSSLPDYPDYYKKHPHCDYQIVLELHELLSSADIIVAHNGDRFDIRKTNARFAYHGMGPPDPSKTVDTLKVARKHFKFTSNRLADLGEHLDLGTKMDTGGFELWRGCMSGDQRSWDKMVRYNKRDVRLLEDVYLELRPWTKTHPNMGVYIDDENRVCPKCGCSDVVWRGYNYTQVGAYRKFKCLSCLGWGQSRHNTLAKEHRADLTKNVP